MKKFGIRDWLLIEDEKIPMVLRMFLLEVLLF
jgi:hypothetical protein